MEENNKGEEITKEGITKEGKSLPYGQNIFQKTGGTRKKQEIQLEPFDNSECPTEIQLETFDNSEITPRYEVILDLFEKIKGKS